MDFKENFMQECKKFLHQFDDIKEYITIGIVVNILAGSVLMWAAWPLVVRFIAADWVDKDLLPNRITLAQSIVMTVTSYVSAIVTTKVIK